MQTRVKEVNMIDGFLGLAVIAVKSLASYAIAQPGPATKVLARGAGKTIVQGGTGQPGFVPVVTTIAFHAEQHAPAVSGGFECLALAPAVPTGHGSGQFTLNDLCVKCHITHS